MSDSCPHDPFRKDRIEKGIHHADLDGDSIPLILRYRDLRTAARDTKTFSSDTPCRVPIPAEEDVRSVRQLPLEVDPPEHTEYRKIVEPFFKRASQPDYIAEIEGLVSALLDQLIEKESAEVVNEFALPLQSRGLAVLMKMPPKEAERWIEWGMHVFRVGEGDKKGAALEDYIDAQIDRAVADPGEDFFSAMTKATYQGRPLTRDEIAGYANIMFAGGRDTVINSITGIIAYLGGHPEALDALRGNPKLVITAGEEFVRSLSPVTHIGRTCPMDTEIQGEQVKAGQRVSLCFASANYDENVFESPEEVRLDRKPNAHVGFGSGPHFCLGAPHARLVIRTVLAQLAERLSAIEILEAVKTEPSEFDYLREVGYEVLKVRFSART
jgi:cytochrome P450